MKHLRKVGGSIMLAVPPVILDMLRLQAGTSVGLLVDGERLIVQASPDLKSRYMMEELLAQCDATAPAAEADREWIDLAPIGNEL